MRKEAGELAALEARYWHGFNDLQLHMRAHAEERDVLLRRVRACAMKRHITRLCSCDVHGSRVNVGAYDAGALSAMPRLLARQLCRHVGF